MKNKNQFYTVLLAMFISGFAISAFANKFIESEGETLSYNQATQCMNNAKRIENERAKAIALDRCFANYLQTSILSPSSFQNCLSLAEQILDYSEFHIYRETLSGSQTSSTEHVSSKVRSQLACTEYYK